MFNESNRTRRPSRLTIRRQRERSKARATLAFGLLAVTSFAVCLGGALGAAIEADARNGMTVSESLASAGFGRASPDLEHRRFAREFRAAINYPAAKPARLIGYCGGRIMAGMEEDSFPAGCAWIESPAGAAAKLEALEAPDHKESI
jgi:hypothetical protein